jgi:amino acid adenylation domain-containing protein
MREFNPQSVSPRTGETILEMFVSVAKQIPGHIAVVDHDDSLTYQELNNKANQLAHYLRSMGVGRETLVGLCVERSIEMIVALLGILKAGGAYVPLDPGYPEERLKYMLDNTQVPILLTQSRLISALPEHEAQTVLLDDDWDRIAAESPAEPELVVSSRDLAYIIYTSGSTGKPKGVMIEHASLLNYIDYVANLFALRPGDRPLQFASINFDASAEEIFSCLTRGATLVLRDDRMISSISFFLEMCRALNITILNLPTAFWHELVNSVAADNIALPGSVRLVVIGGEKASPECLRKWHRYIPGGIRLLNIYGPTECTIGATMSDLSDHVADVQAELPIGSPINNLKAYVLDSSLQPVPVGASGELYLGGVGLARGYLHAPELTAEKFTCDPFSEAPGCRMYKTGDLVSWLPDGSLRFQGRVDDQVKIRGFRIELGEIETILDQHSQVRESVVLAREDHLGEQRLVAYVIPESSTKQIGLWPNAGDYQVWDEVMYFAMTHDKPRLKRYKAAMDRLVKDKVVLDVGTGKDLILTRLCLEAGAKKVYSIEAKEKAYEHANRNVVRYGLQDRVTLIAGDSTTVQLPEKVDVCVLELIGSIGGSEGAVTVLNDARKFMKPGAASIPHRCVTKIAAVSLPDDLRIAPRFSQVAVEYVQKIFSKVGRKFDFRLCINNFPPANVISSHGVFEELDFSGYIDPVYDREVSLTINEEAKLDGFLLWLNLYTTGSDVIDLMSDKYHWLPLYFPVFDGLEVEPGDTIHAICSSWLSEDNVNPDYRIKGSLVRKNGKRFDFEHNSLLYEKGYRSNTFYQKLFTGDTVATRFDEQLRLSTSNLRSYLNEKLPPYMVPTYFVIMDKLPITPNGKIDRRALPEPDYAEAMPDLVRAYVAPRNAIEKTVADIWRDLFKLERVGIHDDFFELGGHSLMATRVVARLRETFQVEIPLTAFFEEATVANVSQLIDALVSIGMSLQDANGSNSIVFEQGEL